MVTDNFEFIKKFIEFYPPLEDEFYFVQVLVRKKDGHSEAGINGDNKNRLLRYYCIKSSEDLISKKDEIVKLCNLFNARAYIHPTKRNVHQVAAKVLTLTAEMYVSHENHKGLKGVYSTACGQSHVSDKLWIVDIDSTDIDKIESCINCINRCEPENVDKIVLINDTVHGVHLITRPFNLKRFQEEHPDIDVHKNNPTLLYYNQISVS